MRNKKINIGDVVVVQMDIKQFGQASSHIGLVVDAPNSMKGHVHVICPGDNNPLPLAFEPSEITIISKHKAK
jgi:hypothetical protein